MSTTSISPIYDLGTRADYLELGVGKKKASHLSAGTNRLAPGFHCDAPSIDDFIEMGNREARRHGRRVKGHGILLNFHPKEFDVHNPEDLQRAGDLGYELAKRAFPHSPAMVVVHADADGGHVHCHIVVLNHDLSTGKAPTANRTHAAISRINDQLMREEGLSVVEQYTAQRTDWPTRRADLAAGIEAGSSKRYDAFYVGIGDRVAEARAEALAVDDLDTAMTVFGQALTDRGVTVIGSEHEVETDHRPGHTKGDRVYGLKYEMLDEWTPTKRPRRRQASASKLSPEFTVDGLERAIEAERRRRALEIQRQQQASAARLQQQAALAAQQQAPEPERDDPTMARMRRVLDGLPPEVEGPTPRDEPDQASLATAQDGPPAFATAPAVDVPEPEQPAPTAAATASASPSSVATAPASDAPYRSAIRDLPAKGAKAEVARDSWAELDEYAHARLQAGQRLEWERGEQRGAKGVSQKLLDSAVGQAMHPDVQAELQRKVDLWAEANVDFEAGRIDDANRKRSLVRRGIFEDRVATARERLIVELTEPGPQAATEDERQL